MKKLLTGKLGHFPMESARIVISHIVNGLPKSQADALLDAVNALSGRGFFVGRVNKSVQRHCLALAVGQTVVNKSNHALYTLTKGK